jgi:hypothetical protein
MGLLPLAPEASASASSATSAVEIFPKQDRHYIAREAGLKPCLAAFARLNPARFGRRTISHPTHRTHPSHPTHPTHLTPLSHPAKMSL